MTGEAVMKSMIPMHDRSNGLGGGFAAYGIYPDYRDFYAFHIFFDDNATRRECETMLKEGFELVQAEQIPIHIIPEITDIPLIWRYFVSPLPSVLHRLQLDEKEFVARTVMFSPAARTWAYSRPSAIPRTWDGFTGSTNMRATAGRRTAAIRRTPPAGGAARIRLRCSTTRSYTTARSRLTMPTAASSKCSATNARCRPIPRSSHTLPSVSAAPFWSTIRGKAASEAERLTYLRTVFSSLLITGPFSIVLGFNGGLMALNDRLKLRSMVTAEKDDLVFIASEEAAIRAMEPDARNVWAPMGGEPVIVRVKEGKY